MARVLFLVHGMGEHPAGWHAGVVQALNESCAPHRAALAARGLNSPLTFGEGADAAVRVIPIAYDDVFVQFWNRHADDADELEALAAAQPDETPGARPWRGLWDFLAAANDGDDTFLRTHLADVLLFRGFPFIRQHVIDLFAERIANTVAKLPGGLAGNEIGFLAHSLGTAVTQATLERLADTPVMVQGKESRVFMLQQAPLFNALFMVANVSRVLEVHDVYQSSVAPRGRASGRPGYVGEYYNFRHRLDPVPMVRRFDPPGWGDNFVPPPPLGHLLEPNVHGYEHYLRHPAVHLNVINGMFGLRPADPDFVASCTRDYEQQFGIATYAARVALEQIPMPCRVASVGAVQHLQTLAQTLPDNASLEEWLRGVVELESAVRAAREACGGL